MRQGDPIKIFKSEWVGDNLVAIARDDLVNKLLLSRPSREGLKPGRDLSLLKQGSKIAGGCRNFGGLVSLLWSFGYFPSLII